MISIIYKWRKVAVFMFIILCIAILLRGSYNVGYQSATMFWSNKWEKRNSKDAMAALRNVQYNRNKEILYQRRMNELINQSEKKMELLQHDVDTANTVANKLREKIDQYVKQSDLSRNPGITPSCATSDRDKIRVLTELFKRSDERAGIMAEIADNARLRGLACESAYHSVRTAKPK